MNSTELKGPLVSVNWLNQQFENPDIIILDASLTKPSSSSSDNSTTEIQISGSRFIDIDNKFSDRSSNLPHTMLSEKDFTREAQKLGINNSSTIIIYDNLGVYSSPRVWWMFRSMGHKNVAVLDGGLPEWVQAGFPTESKNISPTVKGDFLADYQTNFFKNTSDILDSINDSKYIVVDARSEGRFEGNEPEPRPGLCGGHIPNSINFHFEDALGDHKMLTKNELVRQFENREIFNERLIFSCGSGLTACIVALAAQIIGQKDISVYDGSWSEWGRPGEYPVAN